MDSQALFDRLNRWMARLRREQPHSFGCNLPCELVSADWEKKETVLRFHTIPEMSNPRGVTHGGMLAVMVDWAMGSTARAALDYNQTPTIDMQIQYLKPVPLNTDIFIRAKIRRAGKVVVFLTAEVWTEDENDLLTMASGVYRLHEPGLILD